MVKFSNRGAPKGFGDYDYYIKADGTVYSAYDANGDKKFQNADIWALLNSIDVVAPLYNTTKIYIAKGSYTGNVSFTPSSDKGYEIAGSSGLSINQHDVASPAPYVTGTVLISTSSTKKPIDCNVNWSVTGDPPWQHYGQVLIMENITLNCTLLNTYFIDLTDCNGSRFRNCSFISGTITGGASGVSGSVGLYYPTQSNQFEHIIENCEFSQVYIGINMGNSDHIRVSNCEFVFCTTGGILVQNGFDLSIISVHGYHSGYVVRDTRAKNNDHLLFMAMVDSEASGAPYLNTSGGFYTLLNSIYETNYPSWPIETNAIADTLYSQPSDPTGTTSTTAVMMGLGATLKITPQNHGRDIGGGDNTSKVKVTLFGDVANSGITNGETAQLAWGTGTAPVNGEAATGTTFTPLLTRLAAIGAEAEQVSFVAQITGLTVQVAIWVDVQLAAVTAGTATIKKIMAVIEEVY